MTADNTVEFLDLYNRLERLIRERYNLSRDGGAIAWLLSRDKAPRALRDELDYCREVRNFLQHNERIDGSYAVIPSDAMLDALRSTLERFEGVVLVQVAIDAPGEGQAIALAGRLHDCIAGFEVRCVAVASAPRAIDLSSAFALNGFVELPGRTLGTLKEAAA